MAITFPGNKSITLYALPQGGYSTVNPDGTLSITSVTDNGDGTLTIAGTGFGSKTQVAPVLADYVHTAYENGVENSYYGTIADGATLTKTSENASALYTHVTPFDTVKISQAAPRHVGATRNYHLQGGATDINDQWIGKPKADGWPDNLPAGKRPLYLSCWLWTNHSHSDTWDVIPTAAPSGAFTPGEAITVGAFSGIYLGTYGDQGSYTHGRYVFEITGTGQSATGLPGQTITGLSSGQTMIFPSNSLSSGVTPGLGYTLPGTKFIRIWDNPSGAGDAVRFSLAVHDYYAFVSGQPRFVDEQTYLPFVKNQWMHIELEMDLVAGFIRVWFNRTLHSENTFTPDAWGDAAYSPSINDLGWDGGVTGISDSYISEVYVDRDFKRCYIGNASTWTACTHAELQRPTDIWVSNSAKVAKHEGALAGESRWLYMMIDGTVNENGYALP